MGNYIGIVAADKFERRFLATGAFLGASLAGPLLTIALTLVYYDARVRKEGFDLELMMANLSLAPDPTPTPIIS